MSAKPSRNPSVLEQTFLGQPVGVNLEVLGYHLEVIGVKYEFATSMVHLLPNRLEALVKFQIFCRLVDHDFLRLYLFEGLDPRPE